MTAGPARPPYDRELDEVLAVTDLPDVVTADLIAPLRAEMASPPIEETLRGRAIDHDQHVVHGPDGPLTVSVFRPRGVIEPRPCIYYLHGGGMVLGDRFTFLDEALDWVEHHRIVLVSTEYRLAPEHPDPAPVEDAYAGLTWTAAQSDELGIDLDRLVIAGFSAGGGIAAGVALLARDRGDPALFAQLLLSPMLDDANDSVSSRQYTRTGTWSRESNDTGWDALLGSRRGTSSVSPSAAPARAADLSNLPPALVDVGSAEVFRDEAVAYASRLWQAGVQAELHVWPGGFHGFDAAAPTAALSVDARHARAAWLRRNVTCSSRSPQ